MKRGIRVNQMSNVRDDDLVRLSLRTGVELPVTVVVMEHEQLDLAGADEFSMVVQSLPRTDPYSRVWPAAMTPEAT